MNESLGIPAGSKAIVLLSAGLDSTVNLYQAVRTFSEVRVLTIAYGQRAQESELRCSSRLCSANSIAQHNIQLDFFAQFSSGILANGKQSLPTGSRVDIESSVESRKSARAVWVPNRNGVFLNIAAAFAEALNFQYVVPGFNREEAATFADNSADFLAELEKSFKFSTQSAVKTKCFTIDMDKAQIVELGRSLGVPFNWTWPCYQSGQRWCGECESCKRARRAFDQAGVQVENFVS